MNRNPVLSNYEDVSGISSRGPKKDREISFAMSPQTVFAKIAYCEAMLKVAKSKEQVFLQEIGLAGRRIDEAMPHDETAQARSKRFIERLERDLAKLRKCVGLADAA